MADNRLYIVNCETGSKRLLAKAVNGHWSFFEGIGDDELTSLDDWLDSQYLPSVFGGRASGVESGGTELCLMDERDLGSADTPEAVLEVLARGAR